MFHYTQYLVQLIASKNIFFRKQIQKPLSRSISYIITQQNHKNKNYYLILPKASNHTGIQRTGSSYSLQLRGGTDSTSPTKCARHPYRHTGGVKAPQKHQGVESDGRTRPL